MITRAGGGTCSLESGSLLTLNMRPEDDPRSGACLLDDRDQSGDYVDTCQIDHHHQTTKGRDGCLSDQRPWESGKYRKENRSLSSSLTLGIVNDDQARVERSLAPEMFVCPRISSSTNTTAANEYDGGERLRLRRRRRTTMR